MYTVATKTSDYSLMRGGNPSLARGVAGNWVLVLNIVLVVLVFILIASQWIGFQFIKAKWTCPTTPVSQTDVTGHPAAQKQTTFAWSEIVEEAKKIISSDSHKSLSGKAQAICQQLAAMHTQMPSNHLVDTVKTASIILETEYDPALEELKYLLSVVA